MKKENISIKININRNQNTIRFNKYNKKRKRIQYNCSNFNNLHFSIFINNNTMYFIICIHKMNEYIINVHNLSCSMQLYFIVIFKYYLL